MRGPTGRGYVYICIANLGFADGSDSKESSCNVKDLGSVPGLGRFPGGHDNPL